MYSSGFTDEIVDLGVIGFTCDIRKEKIYNEDIFHLKREDNLRKIHQEEINMGYKSGLEKYSGELKINRFQLEEDLTMPTHRIFVFSAVDPLSEEKARKVSADYGLCIEYNSFEDIDSFRNKTNIKYPIQLANDSAVRFLKLTSYPALVIIKNGEIEVQVGF